MQTINGCQTQQNGGEIETLHPLTANHNNNHSNYSSSHFMKNINSTDQSKYLNNNQNLISVINNGNNCHHVFSAGQQDLLRLIGQHLRSLGLSKTTESLIDESGCMLEHPIATNFCNLIMNGEWDKAERSLSDLRTLMDANVDLPKMKFLILEQKYMECLEDGKILEALKCLRDELAPLKYNTDRLHELSSFLMCTGQDDLKKLSKWDGKTALSRQNLMDKLQTFLPPNVMLPPRRLESLITQAIELQTERCQFHNSNDKYSIDSFSLLKDHVCSKDQFPSVCLQVLNDHCDEVWYCKFSNDGTKLATGSKDGALIIWDVNPQTLKLTLNKSYEEHTYGVGWIAWSPDDHYIIVCGTEECTELWIWDMHLKVLKKRMSNNHDDSLTTAAWLPDGQSFVAGGMRGQFYYCDIDGNIRETWESVRVRCLHCSPDGLVLAADHLKRIRNYNFKDMTDSNVIQEDYQIMSFALNKQGNLALLSLQAQGIHLWDLKDKVLVRRFQGAILNNYTNYCTFGGIDEQFVASGSEDNRIYIWNIKNEQPILSLEGHSRSINCVTWNPVITGLVVSVSDDGTIRVWGPAEYSSESTLINTNGSTINNHNHNDNNNNITNTAIINENTTSNSSSSSSSTANNNRSDRSTPV